MKLKPQGKPTINFSSGERVPSFSPWMMDELFGCIFGLPTGQIVKT
jgi:hypothetical protein